MPGWDSFAPPTAAPAVEVAIARAAIEARRQENLEKRAGLQQQIAQKDAEAAENDATLAKLTPGLPMLQQKRDLYRALLNVAFTNKLAWLDSDRPTRPGAPGRRAAEPRRHHRRGARGVGAATGGGARGLCA